MRFWCNQKEHIPSALGYYATIPLTNGETVLSRATKFTATWPTSARTAERGSPFRDATVTLRKWSISIFADVVSEALLTLISLRNIRRHSTLKKASLLFRCPFYTVVGIAEVKHCPDGAYITRTRNASWILRTCADSAKKRIS